MTRTDHEKRTDRREKAGARSGGTTEGAPQPDEAPVKAKAKPKSQAPAKAPARKPDFGSPVVGERHVRRFELLYRRLPVGAHVARVFVTRAGRCLTYPPDGQPTTGELVWNGVRAVYEVDLGEHVSEVREELPSRGDSISFRATIDLVWRVVDPARVVRAGLADVRTAVSPPMLAKLRAVTRRFDVRESDLAELEANRELADGALGADLGLSLRAYVRLSKDETSLEQALIRRKVDQFKQIIEKGDFHQLALQLTLKPEDIAGVVEVLVKERDGRLRAVFEFINRLLESDALDRWQIDDSLRAALKMAQDNLLQVFTAGGRAVPPTVADALRGVPVRGTNGAGVP
jgi:hypothetical protein